jgi:hypothetical protein
MENVKYNLTEPKILNLFLSSLKALYRKQEAKKKNYKKLIGFSVRAQKYDDNSSSNSSTITKKDKTNALILSSFTHNKKKKGEEIVNNEYTTEYSHNSDSSIFTNPRDKESPDKYDEDFIKRPKNLSTNKIQNDKLKVLKHKFFYGRLGTRNPKRFLLENEPFSKWKDRIEINLINEDILDEISN